MQAKLPSSAPLKIAIVGIGALLLTMGSACSFEERSGSFACTSTVDCDTPRTCESGYCVIPSELLPDARVRIDGPAVPDADLSQPDADTNVCAAIDLVDAFADDTAAPLWTAVTDPAITISESNGVLSIGTDSVPGANSEAGYTSVRSDFVFTNSSFMVEVPSMVALDSKAVAWLAIGAGANSEILFQQKMGTLSVQLKLNAGTPKVLASLPYDAVAHRWWRVADSGGTFRVQTSPDGSTWTVQGSDNTPGFFAAVSIDLRMRAFTSGNVSGTVVFDNANGGGVVEPCPTQ